MSFDYDFEESETESSDESDDLGQNIVSLDEGKPNIRKEFTIDEHHDFRPRDSVMPFWATISGNQSRFLSSSGTAKNSQVPFWQTTGASIPAQFNIHPPMYKSDIK
eukprot:TRINITY_DN16302_c0_g1_i10.p2 TRINITY_DN16302_c0_g1~~TRINITY_DN16302_c0_g1_i10.p2  ORF type:complete len:106 (+),score=12.62 TRINITY_DN16302_c0_g1_i10:87-404(+)